jgi:hypothetical protein
MRQEGQGREAVIAKHIPMKSARRSSFKELVAYITHSKDKAVRIGAVRVTHCHQEDAADAVNEVLATQLQNRRACGDKTYHLLISFDAGDCPSPQALRTIEDEVCAALGFKDHQRVSCVHTDTDNLHIHVAINKIHPGKLTIHDPYGDYQVLGAVCQRLELAHGLVQTNHETLTQGARSRALDMEHAAGVESLLGWIRRECLEDLRQAQGWVALHEILGRNGLALREQGNGFVISDQEGRAVKASSIARDLSKAPLVKRLGSFEPPDRLVRAARVGRTYQPRPISAAEGQDGTEDLYRGYQAEQARRSEARKKIKAELREQKHSQLSEIRDRARRSRGLIRGLECDRLSKRLLYHQADAVLRTDSEIIRDRHRDQYAAQLQELKPLMWFDWLAQRAALNDAEALAALRRRRQCAARRANALLGMTRQDRGGEIVQGLEIDGVTKQGTIIYRDGKSAIRDSGGRIEVSDGITQQGLEVALSMAVQRFGQHIAIEGDTAFRERVLHTAKALKLDVAFADRTRQQTQSAVLPDMQMEQGDAKREPRQLDKDNPAEQAARRYITEREASRQQIGGIPRHVLGEPGPQAEIRYAGWRRVDGQFLLLARTGPEEITVIPADAALVARVSGARLGEAIRLDQPVESRGLRL